jgi:hypothetical protein
MWAGAVDERFEVCCRDRCVDRFEIELTADLRSTSTPPAAPAIRLGLFYSMAELYLGDELSGVAGTSGLR